MQVDVEKLMQGDLGRWLAGQSALREAARAKAQDRWFYAGIAALIPLAFLWFGPDWSIELRGILTAVVALAISAWGYAPIAEATRAIKVGINSGIAASLGLEYEHDVEPGGEFGTARTYGLLPDHDRKSCEDRWYGELGGHRFSLYEVHLEERRGSGRNRRWVTVFRGALIQMAFGRDFRSTTLLQRAGKHRAWFGLGGARDAVSFGGHRLALVDQVHPAFAETFTLYGDDPVEARVLVHPSYVEHLLAVEQAFAGDAVRALFHPGADGGEVIVAVESGKLFESGSISAEGDRERVEEAARQFGSLAGLALAINQNERGRALRPAGSGDPRDLGQPQRLRGGFGRRS